MDKILFAIDAVNLNMPALDFACYLGSLTNSPVTGVFLENLVADQTSVSKRAYGKRYIDKEIDETSEKFQNKKKLIEQNISFFKSTMESKSVKWNIHLDEGTPIYELINETRYADLLILDPSISFKKKDDDTPSAFVQDILRESECPVIIAPESFHPVDEIIFTYDNSRSAAFAIKQFTYLFPEYHETKAIVLQVNLEGQWNDQDKKKLQEWFQNRYSSSHFEALKGSSDDKLFDYLFRRKNSFVVMGAYGRSSLSTAFKQSHADILIKTITQPIFISHY